MRTISRVSAAFLLLDGRDKSPILGASILVDGVRRKMVAKGDGHYVFSNLEPTAHVYDISASGYHPARRTLGADPEALPEIIPMQYAPDSLKLRSIPHYRLQFCSGGRPLADTEICLELQTPVGALRLVEPARKGEYRLTLGGGYAAAFLYQPLKAGKAEIMATGFDRAEGCYELQRALDADLPEGTLLRPFWRLSTDGRGTAILPLLGALMQRDELEFGFAWGGNTAALRAAVPDGACPFTVAL